MRIASRTGSRSTPPERRYPQKFEKAVYAGTMAIFFAAVDVLKVAPLAMLQQFTLPNLITSATLLPLAIAANFLGIWLVRWRSQPSRRGSCRSRRGPQTHIRLPVPRLISMLFKSGVIPP